MESRNKVTMCRLCLCENECFINIFEMNDWQGYVAAGVISDLLQCQVSETDCYPHVVCSTCMTKLTDFKLFKEYCQTSKEAYDKMYILSDRLGKHQPVVDGVIESRISKHSSVAVDPTSSQVEVITSDLITSGIFVKEEPPEVKLTESGPSGNLGTAEEHNRTDCTSEGEVYTDPCTMNSTNYESVFQESKCISLSEGALASSSGTIERSERQQILSGEKMVPLLQGDVCTGKEGEERAREEYRTGGKENGKRRSATVKREKEKLECDHCGHVLMTKFGLVQHMRMHGFGHSFDCDVCGKVFQRNYDLIMHFLTHTDSKPYKCKECSKTFSEYKSLKTHMKLHVGSKPYKCGVCSKCFCHNNSLKIHLRSHTGFKPYTCAECSKSFTNNSNLNTHMRSHTGCKPYKCPGCSKSFSQNCSLKRHMKVHADSKPFKCGTCSKGFADVVLLRRHLFGHSKENPHAATTAEHDLA